MAAYLYGKRSMSAHCCHAETPAETPIPPSYRRALWIALVVNFGMFLVEMIGGWGAGSASLLADAVDFFGDAANYALSLYALLLGSIWRSRTALLKGLSMGAYGGYVLAQAAWNGWQGVLPEATTMTAIGSLALVANVSVAALLYAYRGGDANMRSVWLCSRNDAIGNLAILLAAAGVFGTGSGWPDLLVAVVMAGLGLSAAQQVVRQARAELRAVAPQPQHCH